jgi:hypothetical protein
VIRVVRVIRLVRLIRVIRVIKLIRVIGDNCARVGLSRLRGSFAAVNGILFN